RPRDGRAAAPEPAQHEPEPVDPLEPPVPEELAVEGRDEHPVAPGLAPVRGELVADRRAEVLRMRANALRGHRHRVLGLVAEVGRTGHAPVPEAGPVILAMELAVERIARIALRRGPHLAGDLGMARHRGDGGVRDEIRPEEIDRWIEDRLGLIEDGDASARARVTLAALRAERLRRATDLATAHERGIGEEVGEPVALERALEARLVRALRKPDPRRLETGEPLRRGEPDAQLRFDRTRVEQRQVPMRRGRGEDLDLAGAREISERADDVPPEALRECVLQPSV